MYLTPEAFLEKYIEDGRPFFVIYDGTTANEKKRMSSYLTSETGKSKEEYLEEGEEKLKAFFSQYPSGRAYIMTKGHRNSDNQYALYSKVQWGDASSIAGISQSPVNPAQGMGQMNQFMQMMTFVTTMLKPQVEATQRELKLEYELQNLRREKEEAENNAPFNMKEAAMAEMIGLIKPIGEAIAGSLKIKSPIQQPASISGMPGESNTDNTAFAPRNKPGQNAVSLDHLIQCCKAIHAEMPEYHINELFEVLTALIQQNKTTLLPMIEQAMSDYQAFKNEEGQ